MTSTSLPPAPAPPAGQPRAGMWVLALVVAAIVALLGVQAAIGAFQRKQYADTAQIATYFLRNGNAIRSSTQRLEFVDFRDRGRVKDAFAALEAGDRSRFNRIMAQADVDSLEQRRLQQQVQEYKAGFDQASNR